MILKRDNRTIDERISDTYLKGAEKRPARKGSSRAPWIIAAVAVAIAATILVSRSNIDVKVRIIGEVPGIAGGSEADKFDNLKDKGIFIVKGSEPNKKLLKNVYFTGDAVTYSKAVKDQIILCNSRGSGWGGYVLEFKDPVDFTRLGIKYKAKGARGNEYLIISLVDGDNRTYRLEKDISSELTDAWQAYTANFGHIKNALDLTNIAAVNFEVGTLTAGNSPTATIYLKDIYLKRAGQIKWL